MSEWVKYMELEPIRRLKNDGRELLGKHIDWTEKRDGENVSCWLDNDAKCEECPILQRESTCKHTTLDTPNPHVKISSHDQVNAAQDIVSRFKSTPEYDKISELLTRERGLYHKKYICYGELLKTVSPTRIERNKKHIHWILFDIYDMEEKRYLNYIQMYQLAYNYHIPVVRCLTQSIPKDMQDLNYSVENMLRWCKRHRREGVVGKCYSEQIFFKEKINLPRPEKLDRPNRINLPEMDEHTIIRAFQHAFDEVGEENWKDKSKAMPAVAKHMAIEAREHNFSTPHNMYQLYLNTSVDILKSQAL